MEKILKNVNGVAVETTLKLMKLSAASSQISSDDGPEPEDEQQKVIQQVSVINHIGPAPTVGKYRLSLTDAADQPCYVDVMREWISKNEVVEGGLFIRRTSGPAEQQGDFFASTMEAAATPAPAQEVPNADPKWTSISADEAAAIEAKIKELGERAAEADRLEVVLAGVTTAAKGWGLENVRECIEKKQFAFHPALVEVLNLRDSYDFLRAKMATIEVPEQILPEGLARGEGMTEASQGPGDPTAANEAQPSAADLDAVATEQATAEATEASPDGQAGAE